MFILHLLQSFFKSSLYPRGDNSEIVKMYRQLFNESLGNFNQTCLKPFLGKVLRGYSDEGQRLFSMGDYKYIDDIEKSSSAEPLGQFSPNLALSTLR